MTGFVVVSMAIVMMIVVKALVAARVLMIMIRLIMAMKIVILNSEVAAGLRLQCDWTVVPGSHGMS